MKLPGLPGQTIHVQLCRLSWLDTGSKDFMKVIRNPQGNQSSIFIFGFILGKQRLKRFWLQYENVHPSRKYSTK